MGRTINIDDFSEARSGVQGAYLRRGVPAFTELSASTEEPKPHQEASASVEEPKPRQEVSVSQSISHTSASGALGTVPEADRTFADEIDDAFRLAPTYNHVDGLGLIYPGRSEFNIQAKLGEKKPGCNATIDLQLNVLPINGRFTNAILEIEFRDKAGHLIKIQPTPDGTVESGKPINISRNEEGAIAANAKVAFLGAELGADGSKKNANQVEYKSLSMVITGCHRQSGGAGWVIKEVGKLGLQQYTVSVALEFEGSHAEAHFQLECHFEPESNFFFHRKNKKVPEKGEWLRRFFKVA